MKKIISVILVILMFLLSLGLVQAAGAYSGHNIEVTLVSQDPDPVEPGQVAKLRFKIENDGTETTSDVIVKLDLEKPFSMYGGTAEKNIGKLRAAATGADAEIVEFLIKIDEQAAEKETELELEVRVGDASYAFTNDEFLIDIQTHDAVLEIVSITPEPKQIPPGGKSKITVLVKNLADSLLKDVKFKLDFSGSSIPLAPYQSSSERRIAQLQSNYQKVMVFDVVADPEANAGLYKVPLNITYNDEKGNSYLIEDVMALTVGDKPSIKPYIKKSSVLQSKMAGKVTLELANAGTTGVKFLEMEIMPSTDFQLVSTTNYFYIGDVDSDDTESEEIDIYVNNKAKSLNIPIKLKYSDANNQNYQQQFNLKMNLYSASQLKKFGVIPTSMAGVYFLVVILIVVGILMYRSHKKNPQEFSQRMRKWRNRIPFLRKKR